MPKTKISEFSATPGNNTDIDGINIAEGCAPSGINDAIRELMSQLKDFQAGTAGDSFNGPVGTTTAAAGAFTTLTTSSTVTHNGGTANGVAYLNGSKVLTTGSALSFDGTNLGIGATTPLQLLHLSSASAPGMQLTYQGVGASRIGIAAGNALTFGLDTSNGATEQMRLTSTGLGIGTTSIAERLVVNGNASVDVYKLRSNTATPASTDSFIYRPADNTLGFGTASSEHARITSGGDLLVGTTSTAFTGKVVALQATSASNVITAWNSATAGDNSLIGFFTDGGTGRGSITYNRAGGLVAYNTTSDYRAKDIIGPAQNTGSTIDALKVYEGVMKGATQPRPMMIAHEAQAVVPFCVSGSKDEVNEDGTPKYQQMDHASLVPLLIAEIQSLRQRVAALEAK